VTSRKAHAKKTSAIHLSVNLLDALKNLLLEGVAGTQEEMIQALEKQGIHINQSKVSRLLRKVGAVKIINERGESVYSLQREPVPPSTERSVAQLIIDVVANETMIVIHTNPGSASLIARLLDYQVQELGILGTVAGDDTLFVVPKSNRDIGKTVEAIKTRLYGD